MAVFGAPFPVDDHADSALGFVRAQTIAVVVWQALTIASIGVLIGWRAAPGPTGRAPRRVRSGACGIAVVIESAPRNGDVETDPTNQSWEPSPAELTAVRASSAVGMADRAGASANHPVQHLGAGRRRSDARSGREPRLCPAVPSGGRAVHPRPGSGTALQASHPEWWL